MKPRRRIALIDGDVLVYRSAFAVERNVEWGDGSHTLHAEESDAKQAVDMLIQQILKAVETKEYQIALTCHETVNFRKEFYPQYKENRQTLRKPLVWKYLRTYLTEEYKAQVRPNLEADDILGIWTTKEWTGNPDRIIVSIDKDFKSVPGKLYNFQKGEFYDITEEEADYNFFKQTIVGDKTDNYPGVPGIGPKKADSILENARNQGQALGMANRAMWNAILFAYRHKGFGPEYALTQARCARILRACDYDFTNKKPILWEPPL